MVSDRYEVLLNKLIFQTDKGNIKWRPIQEYIDLYVYPHCQESGIAQYIQFLNCKEWNDLNIDKSFFAKKDGYTIAILDYKSISGKDGSISDCLEIVGGIYGSPVRHFPEYIEGGFVSIQEAILKYWEWKKNDYNLDISDNLEILRVFTKED